MIIDVKSTGKKIAEGREARGISRYQLAHKANVDLGRLGKLETGAANNVTIEFINKLAVALNIPAIDLISEKPLEGLDKPETKALYDLYNIKDTIAGIEDRLRHPQPKVIRLPDYGYIPCSTSFKSTQAPVEYIDGPIRFTNGINPKRLFVLHATGDSLIEEEIYNGDIVLAEKGAAFVDGKKYVVNIPGDGCTIKKAYRAPDDSIRLVSSNYNYTEMAVDDTDIIGRVVVSFRLPQKH
jgi:phage repressor protein C with HTH and peptisase S24 domain